MKNRDYKNIEGMTLSFKYGVSRGYETQGYTTCGCWFNGGKVGFCMGGGYDLAGTSFGQFIETLFHEELKRKSAKDLYGFSFFNEKTRKRQTQWSKNCSEGGFLDGGCGFNSMMEVFNRLGYSLKYVLETTNEKVYTITTHK